MTAPPLRIIFMGTPAFAVPAFQALLNSRHQVAAAYTQPPRPSGRGHAVRMSPVHQLALAQGIPVFTPSDLKNEEEKMLFASHRADLAVVVAYGLILPNAIVNGPYARPFMGCFNVHASLLPRWRGAAPIQRAIEAGDQETGITIMKMDAGLDTGPMLLQKRLPIAPQATAQHLYDALAEMGGPLLLEALEAYIAGTLQPTPQPTEGVAYAAKLTREEGQMNWRQPASVLARKIQAFAPWPGAWFEHEGLRLKVLAAEVLVNAKGNPGAVLDDRLAIACGEDALRIKAIQRPGGAALDARSFLQGYSLPVGTVLSCPAIS